MNFNNMNTVGSQSTEFHVTNAYKNIRDIPEGNGAADLIIDYLAGKGLNHNCYYHYTNINSAIGIIRNEYFHLSIGDRMNDKQEVGKGDQTIWDRLYLACFNYGDSENMGLWGLYCIPWQEGVRIEIPQKAMKLWINSLRNNLELFEAVFEQGAYRYSKIDIEGLISAIDIAYIDRYDERKGDAGKVSSYKLKHDGGVLTFKYDISTEPKLTGYVKNAAWSYENEVRFRLLLKEKVDIKTLAIRIPLEVINSMQIKAAPWFEGSVEDIIMDRIREFRIAGTSTSKFSQLVSLKSACHFCAYGKFKRRT